MNKNIAQVVVGLPVEGPFDYLVPDALKGQVAVGQRVYVPFGPRPMVGFVTALLPVSAVKNLKPIYAILDQGAPALAMSGLALADAFSRHYGCSQGEAVEAGLPVSLRKKIRLELPDLQPADMPAAPGSIELCHSFFSGEGLAWLLVEIRAVCARRQGVIVLTPEIIQAQKVCRLLQKELSLPVALLDRRLPAKEEKDVWTDVRTGKVPVVVGTRSAIFAPVRRLGLIVVCDEDHRAYKQEQSPFYHAREVARMRSRIEGARLVMMTAAPSAELWLLTRDPGVKTVRFLPQNWAELRVIDMANYNPQRSSVVSFPLQNYIQLARAAQGRVLLLLNRRGSSTSTRCNQCGKAVHCPRCNVALSHIEAKNQLVCHLCSWSADFPEVCPSCHGHYLRSWGGGIEKVAREMKRLFPESKVVRVDRDTTRPPSDAGIVISTQAVWRYLDDVPFDLIAVLDFDAQLNRMDFRSEQQAFAALVRLRSIARKQLAVQTFQPGNYALERARKLDFDGFYARELEQRRESGLPPFKYLLEVTVRGREEAAVSAQAEALCGQLRQRQVPGVDIQDAQPDFQPKLRDQFRYIIMLRAAVLEPAHAMVKEALRNRKGRQKTIVTVSVDP